MIVAAIDVSGSTNNPDYATQYRESIHQVLTALKPPIRVIYWNHQVEKNEILYEITKNVSNFESGGLTQPCSFMKCLPADHPIELFIFTDGRIDKTDVQDCHSVLKKKNIQFEKVHLYYIGIESAMNLRFTDVFAGIPQTIHINTYYVGCVSDHFLNWDDITFEDIMKDDSFKATILTQINSPDVDKSVLKNQINLLTYRILKEYCEDKFSIQSFYMERDVEGCIDYVRKHYHSNEKVEFQKKMSSIVNLFNKNIDTYSLKHFEPATRYTLKCAADDNDYNEEEEEEENEKPLNSKLLMCDILLQHCKVACIPLKVCKDNVWMDKKILRNPFVLLESDTLIQRIVHQVEPYIMDYKNVYNRLKNPNVSPFSRDELQGVYLLHHDSIDVQDMIQHNNFVLSTLFQNKLPGKPILWHMVFLYIMALRRFSEKKEIFFEEIRFLGQQEKYFIALVPFIDPPIIEDLNCCFWYLAHVCHKAFPNSRMNVLRKPDFLSGTFLEFYRNVYETDYVDPPQLLEWQVWHKLRRSRKFIFRILAHYFHHEEVVGLEKDFQIILYRERKQQLELSKEFQFLSQFSLEKILDFYLKVLKVKNPLVNYTLWQTKNNILYDEEESTVETLSHVQINPMTCHPYVICPVTGKYWKDCIGEYNIKKYSYVRLFKRFCEKYQKYPENSDHLLCFFNMYMFQHKNEIPEVFNYYVRNEMEQVLEIFKPIMNSLNCETYLRRAKKYSNEICRMKMEEKVSKKATDKSILKRLLRI